MILAVLLSVIFSSTLFDFGDIKESDGVVSHTFIMKNDGDTDIQISKAVPSCSCTLADYPRQVVKAGSEAEVTISYSPSGAVGRVYRSVDLFDQNNQIIGTLEISANVSPIDRSIQERYHYALGNYFYVNLNRIPFGYVYHGTEKTRSIFLASVADTKRPIEIKSGNPNLYFTYPDSIAAGEEVEVKMTYKIPDDKNLFKTYSDTLYIYSQGEPTNLPIVTSMIALDSIPKCENAPALLTYPSFGTLSEVKVFGTLTEDNNKEVNDKYVAKINISNDGESDLFIKHINLPEFAKSNLKNGTIINVGEARTLEIYSSVKTQFRFAIFTNDPKRPVKEIEVK